MLHEYRLNLIHDAVHVGHQGHIQCRAGLKSTVLLILSLMVATLSLGTGRTTVLQGVVHLVIFAVYLFTTIVP